MKFAWAGKVYEDDSREDKWVCGNLFISKREYFQGYPHEHYQVYRAVERVPAGRMPWTVDNRRLHSDPLFSLEDAIAFARTAKAA